MPDLPFVTAKGHNYLNALLYENVNDPPVRKRFRRSLGFCREHSLKLISMVDAFGVALLYLDLLTKQAAIALSQKRLPVSKSPCELCNSLNRFERSYIDTLSAHRDNAELQRALASSDGLCLKHLQQLSSLLPEESLPEWVRSFQLQRLQSLRTNLAEYVRKQDVQFQKELQSAEGLDACERTIDFLTGTNN